MDRARAKRLQAELTLAVLPTAAVLTVFALIENFARQRLLFTSLAASAFLIYLKPDDVTNRVRTLAIAQVAAATIGAAAQWAFDGSYVGAAIAMLALILLMIVLDAMHPPAVSTSLAFAFKDASISQLTMFALAIGMLIVLVVLQRASVRLARRLRPRHELPDVAK